MTAHVVYEAVDPDAALTVSARGVKEVVRGHIGFDGLLLSDDLSMQALGGTLGERAAKVPWRPAATSRSTATARWPRWSRSRPTPAR